jgi:acylphosphatase
MFEQKIQAKVTYNGRVQGVGFRISVTRIACGYEVTGWVRNRSDGRVEILAEGEEDEVKDFLTAVEESHLKSFIREVNIVWQEAENTHRGFSIVQ